MPVPQEANFPLQTLHEIQVAMQTVGFCKANLPDFMLDVIALRMLSC